MRGASPDALGTFGHQQVGSLGDGASRVDHVVNDNNILALNISDGGHGSDYVCSFPRLMAYDHRAGQLFGVCVCPLCSSHVRGCDGQIL